MSDWGALMVGVYQRIRQALRALKPSKISIAIPTVIAVALLLETSVDGWEWSNAANDIIRGKYGDDATLWLLGLFHSGDIAVSNISTNCSYARGRPTL